MSFNTTILFHVLVKIILNKPLSYSLIVQEQQAGKGGRLVLQEVPQAEEGGWRMETITGPAA